MTIKLRLFSGFVYSIPLPHGNFRLFHTNGTLKLGYDSTNLKHYSPPNKNQTLVSKKQNKIYFSSTKDCYVHLETAE